MFLTLDEILLRIPENHRDRTRRQINRWRMWGIVGNHQAPGDAEAYYTPQDLEVIAVLLGAPSYQKDRERATRLAVDVRKFMREQPVVPGSIYPKGEVVAFEWQEQMKPGQYRGFGAGGARKVAVVGGSYLKG